MHFGLIVLHIFQYASFTYQYFFRIYLYIFHCALDFRPGGGKESRTPDLLLARQAL